MSDHSEGTAAPAAVPLPAEKERREPRTVRSVTHAMQLLKEIARSNAPSTLGDLAAAVGLSKPATFNLLKTLELEGLVSKDSVARYSLTWGVYELGSAVVRSTDVTRIARVHLDHLAEVTGEAVLLAILDQDSVLYLDRGQAMESFVMVANVGRRSPLHTNASGKVLLAGQPSEYAESILSRPLESRTAHTITSPDILREQLDLVRSRGFATCDEEQEEGLSSLAAPVVDYTGRTHAALTIAGPTKRICRTREELLLHLRDEAARISNGLGASVSPRDVGIA